MDDQLSRIIEAIIFAADQPVKSDFLLEILNHKPIKQLEIGEGKVKVEEGTNGESKRSPEVDESRLIAILEGLEEKYSSDQFPFAIKRLGGGYQFYTKQSYFPYVRQAALINQNKRLSRVALEALSIIAYRQPITKVEIEFIRGVNSDYAVQKLLDKKLISIVGRAEAPGRPLLYATSPFFMEYFGLDTMEDLPKLKEFDELEEAHLALFKQHQEEEKQEKDAEDLTTENEQIETKSEEDILGKKGREPNEVESRQEEEKPETENESETLSAEGAQDI